MESWYFLIVLGVLLTAVLSVWMASPSHKGAWGERAVHGILRQSLPTSDYAVLRDITLRTAHGTAQIDHVVVSRFGIFVIETKNLPGWIFGSEKDSHWTQSLGHARMEFPNPLRQNQVHVRALQELLGLKPTKFHSVVVFAGKSEFRKPMPVNVMQLDRLIAFIQVRNTQLLTPGEAARAVAAIESSRLEPGAAAEAQYPESLRARYVRSAGPAMGELAPTLQPARGPLAVRALAGVASVALLLVAANALVGGFDGWRTIGGAWPAAGAERPTGPAQPSRPESSQPAAADFDPAELRCGYSIETRRCACFDPAGVKVPMDYEACKAVADENAR